MTMRFPVGIAVSIGLCTGGLALLGGVALAHSYDTSVPPEPDKVLDGAPAMIPGDQNGVPGYWVEYTRFSYRDMTPHFHEIELAFREIESAYCVAAGSMGGDDSAAVHCHPGNSSQDALYTGSVSPHAQGLRIPQDKKEFASYLSATTNKFANGQNGGVNQANAVGGSRYAQVADQKQFDAATARMYVFQFAAAANRFAANTVDGMASGAQAYYTMSPASQEFMQVAAVYKGNLAAAAGNYNNNALRALLQNKGFSLAGRANVGNNDVETLGAVAAALDAGVITLDDIAASGAIGDRAKYAKAIEMVDTGTFALELADYDRAAITAGKANGNLNANSGNAGFGAPGKGVDQNPPTLGTYYRMFAYQNRPTRVEQLAALDPVFQAMLELHDLNGVGRIYGAGEAQNFVASMRCFGSLIADGQRTLSDLPQHDRNHMLALDVNRDGVVSDAELKDALPKIAQFATAVAADAREPSGGMAPGGEACGRTGPTPIPPPTPAPPPPPVRPPTGYGS